MRHETIASPSSGRYETPTATGVLTTQLAGLAGTLAELKARVRAAVAGELGRAVGDAVRHVVRAVVQDEAPERRARAARWVHEDEDEPWTHHGHTADGGDDVRGSGGQPIGSTTTVVTAGMFVGRWWLARRGTALAAAALGLGVGLLGAVGGSLARTAVAVLAAVADVLAATDALGSGAARLGRT